MPVQTSERHCLGCNGPETGLDVRSHLILLGTHSGVGTTTIVLKAIQDAGEGNCYKPLREVEAPSGFEPLHKGFADLSLSHLGTAPQ